MGSGITSHVAQDEDVDACVGLWLRALKERDGRGATAGTAERCRGKLKNSRVSWRVYWSGHTLTGFGLVSEPGSGYPTDPQEAAYLSLIAVDPHAQGAGLGKRILTELVAEATCAGYPSLVLHVMTNNTAAVALYTGQGWLPHGPLLEHPLTKETVQTYVLDLGQG